MALVKIQNLPNIMAVVDDEDFERISRYSWFHNKGSGDGSIHAVIEKLHYPMANVVMNNFAIIFDHKDRNPFNNSKANLREATLQQNQWNRSKTKKYTSSKYKGVSIHKGKWRARIDRGSNRFHLGLFSSENEAAIAYNNKAKELFGEFACLNVIVDDSTNVI